ncbi:MAG: YdcF family protein [Myxococcaceae bacterium]
MSVALAVLGALVGLVGVVAWRVHRLGRSGVMVPRRRTGVVLGALVWPDGRASDALVDRVRVAVELLHAGHVERLILTGGSPDGRVTEAHVMAQLAQSHGARPDQLVLEDQARSTFDNARLCAALLAKDGEREVVLVTCDFHVARSLAQFHAHEISAVAVPSPRRLARLDRVRVTLRESLALLRRPHLLRFVLRTH